MKLQPESKKQLKNVALGTLACTAGLVLVFLLLNAAGVYRTRPLWVCVSAFAGWAVAVGNFALLCLTVQKAAGTAENAVRVRAIIQMSYTARLVVQAVWCVVALAVPQLQPVAGIAPLLFPRLTLSWLNRREKRAAPEAPRGTNNETR